MSQKAKRLASGVFTAVLCGSFLVAQAVDKNAAAEKPKEESKPQGTTTISEQRVLMDGRKIYRSVQQLLPNEMAKPGTKGEGC